LLDKFDVRRRSDLMLETFDLVSLGCRKPQASLQAPVWQDDVKTSSLLEPGLVASALGSVERRLAR
jgi:hypothetical protein